MANLQITTPDGSTPEAGQAIELAAGRALELRGDWAGARYLCSFVEYEGLHHSKLVFRFFATGESDPRLTVTMAFMPGLATTLVYDLHHLDAQTLFLPRIPGRLKATNMGRRIEPAEVDRVEMELLKTGLEQHCRLAPPTLRRDHPPPRLRAQTMVDRFGQLTNRSWLGRCRDEDLLRQTLETESARSEASFPEEWSLYGGSKAHRFIGTGFFRTQWDGSRWWLVDPDGHGFFSAGLDCVRDSESAAIVPGTEECFEWLPREDGDFADCCGANVAWGMAEVAFGRANLKRAFAAEWRERWETMTAGRMRRWRFNTVGNWSDTGFARKSGLPYVLQLSGFPATERRLYRDLPDVFDPAYETAAEAFAQQLADYTADSCLVGYFLCNEPKWGFGATNLMAEVLEDQPGSYTRHAFRNFLAMRYDGDEAAWRSSWGLEDDAPLRSFDDVVDTCVHRCAERWPQSDMDLRIFSREIVRRFVEIPATACKAVDPNHLNLGIRFAWIADEIFYEIGDLVDVFSINCYRMLPDTAVADAVMERCQRPLLIGEFHFGALDAGLAGTGLRAVATQEYRGLAYRNYLEACAAHPGIVGCHYFTLNDQPGLGRFDGECWQIGLVDVCHRPYDEMLAQVSRGHEALYRVQAGEEEPFSARVAETTAIAF